MNRVLYGSPLSGNVHRVRVFLSMLGLPFEEKVVDLVKGEQRGPAFRAISPTAQVPVLVDADLTLFDSHAILLYLANKYDDGNWLPKEPGPQARVLQWMFFDANEIHNGVGWARNHYGFGIPWDGPAAKRRGEQAIAVVETRLSAGAWLELGRPTLADIACFPLIALASDATISLAQYPRVCAWLERIRQLPGYLHMRELPPRTA